MLLFTSVFPIRIGLNTTNPTVVSSVLEYPHFKKVIHWDGMKRVVLEQPQILESYILMPVFGLLTLDVFKRRIYVRVLVVNWIDY